MIKECTHLGVFADVGLRQIFAPAENASWECLQDVLEQIIE